MQDNFSCEDFSDLPDHVRDYLLRRAVSCLPRGVFEELKGLSPEEIRGLEKVGARLDEACADHRAYACAVH
jgi:hypothetical protein